MIRRPPRSTQSRSSAASDVYKRQIEDSHSFFVSFPCFDRSASFPSYSSQWKPILQILDESFIRQRSMDESAATNSDCHVEQRDRADGVPLTWVSAPQWLS